MSTPELRILYTATLLLPLAAAPATAQAVDSSDYRSVLAAAAVVRIEGAGWIASGLDLGRGILAGDTLRMTLRNGTAESLLLGVDVRARPGLWLTGAWQRQTAFEVGPGEAIRVALPYRFPRATPEATLRIGVGPVRRASDGSLEIGGDVVRHEFVLGAGNPGADDPRRSFRRLVSEHLELYAWRGSLADRRAEAILEERETALRTLSEWLQVSPPERIRLVFYPDSATKTEQTGHIGAGWATDNTLVEIHNEVVQLDPYHELAHIVAGALGSPPALLNEGFATWSAEQLGADALAQLGNPGRTVDEVACAHLDELFTLRELLARDDIGGPDSRAGLSYPHAASVVRFLVTTRGIERFRDAYRTLRGSSESAVLERNAESLERIYGQPLEALEREWQRSACGVRPVPQSPRSTSAGRVRAARRAGAASATVPTAPSSATAIAIEAGSPVPMP